MYIYYYNRERDKNSKIKVSNQKNSHMFLKEALKDYIKRKQFGYRQEYINNIKIEKGLHGKPYFSNLKQYGSESLKPISFSISHSGNYWACIIGEIEVGIDIEVVNNINCKSNDILMKTRNYEAIAKRFFTRNEYEFVKKYGSDAFLEIWTRKEAYIKQKGTGFSEGLNTFEVIESGKYAEKVKGIYINKIDLTHGIKAVYCTKEKKQVKDIINLFE
ncbi:4'-phosphopantetheinyl transferase family protein [Anaerovorax odorimutans]|uniref:4'-phosphopantetheinyl transferase family protein n=1 Tax=Anaerovorax odorimutans TaxID=109327 RepID=UPI00041BFB11|nr:4'-phosphopantetheinyl transferase superfamily protein [Anaerovorax odorimutans]